MKRILLVAAVAAVPVLAECPNACSGNGECGPKDACACYDGFVGADCSQRTCPYSFAFVDVPQGDLNHNGVQGSTIVPAQWETAYSKVQWNGYKQAEYWPTLAGLTYGDSSFRTSGTLDPIKIQGGGWAAVGDEAHFYAECSGKGACDRTTGMCECYSGFSGASCQRLSCPNDCSGHGICRTVKELAATKATKRLVDSVAGVNTYSGPQDYFVYRLWDAEKHRACACDHGYTGFDCSLRECPRGDDPLTNTAATCGGVACVNEVQAFMVAPTQGAVGDGDVQYRLRFFDYNGFAFDTNDFPIKTRINYGLAGNAAKKASVEAGIKSALEALPNNVTGTVTVAVTGDATAGTPENLRISVTFATLSGNVPDMNVLQGSLTATQGSPAVAQPFQRVQLVTLTGITTTTTISATVFPLNLTNVRKDTALTARATGGAVVDDTTTVASALAAVGVVNSANVQTAVLAAVRNVPSVAYHGQSSVTARVDNPSAGTYTVTLILPNANFGSNLIKWTFANGGAASVQSVLSTDGNKEFSLCSNRGTCDSTTGLCKCFTGYYGSACDTQSALAL